MHWEQESHTYLLTRKHLPILFVELAYCYLYVALELRDLDSAVLGDLAMSRLAGLSFRESSGADVINYDARYRITYAPVDIAFIINLLLSWECS